jgi:hypothetical protein
LVRPLGGAFQIVAGHHRKAAAGLAGLVTVPCWVREMGDEEAFMALVLANSQSELLPLERGMHALRATELDKHGSSIKAYAEAASRPEQTVNQEHRAARVASSCMGGNLAKVAHCTRPPPRRAARGALLALAGADRAPDRGGLERERCPQPRRPAQGPAEEPAFLGRPRDARQDLRRGHGPPWRHGPRDRRRR